MPIFFLVFVSQAPCKLQGDCTVLHVSKVKKKNCDSINNASLLTVFLSLISGISPSAVSCYHSEDLGPLLRVERELVLDSFYLGCFVLYVLHFSTQH